MPGTALHIDEIDHELRNLSLASLKPVANLRNDPLELRRVVGSRLEPHIMTEARIGRFNVDHEALRKTEGEPLIRFLERFRISSRSAKEGKSLVDGHFEAAVVEDSNAFVIERLADS